MSCNYTSSEEEVPQVIEAKFHFFQTGHFSYSDGGIYELNFNNARLGCDPDPIPKIVKDEIERQLLEHYPVSGVPSKINSFTGPPCYTEFTVPMWGLFWKTYSGPVFDSKYNYSYYHHSNFSEVGFFPQFVRKGGYQVFDLSCVKNDYQGQQNVTWDYGGLGDTVIKEHKYRYSAMHWRSTFNVTEDMAGSYEVSCHYSQDNNVTDFNKTIKLNVHIYKVVSSSDECSDKDEVTIISI